MERNEWADRFVDNVVRRSDWDTITKTSVITLVLVFPIVFALLFSFYVFYENPDVFLDSENSILVALVVSLVGECFLASLILFSLTARTHRHLRRDMLDYYQIPIAWRGRIKQGEDYTAPDGTLIPHSRLTTPARPARKYAYCSDTAYSETYLPLIEGCDLLYHEATFAQSEAGQARLRYHSTAAEAAEAARRAGARRLLLGHFSARYPDCAPLLQEARSVFPPALLSEEGKTYAL